MFKFQGLVVAVTMLACASSIAGSIPGPAADELFIGTFEGVGAMRNFVENTGLVVPADGLPVLLQEDNDNFYLAKCRRLDCATGVDRHQVATTDNRSLRAHLAVGNDGLPVLAYWDRLLDALRFDRCNDASCADRTTETLAAGMVSGLDIVIGNDGFPIVGFMLSFGGSSRSVVVVKCNDLVCDDTNAAATLDDGILGAKVSLGLDDSGFPIVTYVRTVPSAPGQVTRTLRVMGCDSASCDGVVTEEDVDLAPLFVLTGSSSDATTMVVPLLGHR